MEYLTNALFFVGGAAVFSITYALFMPKRVKRPPDPRVLTVMKHIGDLRIEVADLRDLYERLMTSHKRLRSSAGMAKLRDMDPEEKTAGPSDFDALVKLGLVKGKPL